MTLRVKRIFPALFPAVCIAVLSAQLSPPVAERRLAAAPLKLTIRVYNLATVSPHVLKAAENEAARMLRDTHIRFAWLNCPSQADLILCQSPEDPDDLQVRLMATALPQLTANALGVTLRSKFGDSALVFYDRVEAHRTGGTFSHQILGRVMAHEIVHLLLPSGRHENIGLMRAEWDPKDLSFGSQQCLGLSAEFVRVMQREALRRMLAANATLARTQAPSNTEPDLNGEPE